MLDLLLFFIILLTILNYYIARDIAYPAFIFSLVWCFTTLIYYIVVRFNLIQIRQISSISMLIYLGGICFFSIGNYIVTLYFKMLPPIPSYDIKKISVNPTFNFLLFILPIVILPFYIQRAILISQNSGINYFFIGLRAELVRDGGMNYGLLKYIIPITTFNTIFRMIIKNISNKKIDGYLLYSSITISLIYFTLTTGRTFVLFLLTALIGLNFIKKNIRIRYFLFSGLVFIAIFFVYSFVLAKGAKIDAPFFDNIFRVAQMFIWYIISGISAFDLFLKSHLINQNGVNSFRFIFAFFSKLGLTLNEPTPLKQVFVNIPNPANVYTIYYTYVKDFGVFLTYFFLTFYAAIHSYLYQRSKTGKIVYIYFYAILIYPLVMSIFQDQYLSLLSTWIQYSLAYFITFKLFVNINYRKVFTSVIVP